MCFTLFYRNTFNFNPEAEIVLYIKQGEYFIDNTLHFDNIKPGILNMDKKKKRHQNYIF